MTGLAPAGDGFFNEPGFRIMVCEELGLALHQLGGMGSECFGDLCMQLLARPAQQAAMRRVLHQRVLEAIHGIGRRAALEHQFGGDEASEGDVQLVLGETGDSTQQRVGELASDSRADLRHEPHRRQAVEPRHQRGVERRRDRKRRQCPIEQIAIRLLAQQTALQDALGQFFDKQRHAIGALDDLGDDLIWQRPAAGDLLDQSSTLAPVQAIEGQHRHLRLTGPGRLELGAERHDQQHRQIRSPLDYKVEQLARGRVDPMHVLENHHQRLLARQTLREKLFGAMLSQLEADARHRPVLMVFEDAQWIDPTSRELLDLTVDRARRRPVMLVITFRPEFQPPWGDRSHITSLALNRLGERDGEALVQKLAGHAALTADVVAEIVERTDGVPLFVEELTKAVLESAGRGDRVAAVLATTSLAALSVPATLHASLMARLDRLGPAPKEVAQIGAVLGREFAYELIEPVAQREERELQASLGQLGDAGLLFCRGTPPHASYLFKHALVQDAAYSTLLRGRRQELHARVAAALEEHFADFIERQPELLAHHLTAAGDTERAVDQWLKAGQYAAGRLAHVEAIAHLERGLALLGSLPETPARDAREIDLQLALGSLPSR